MTKKEKGILISAVKNLTKVNYPEALDGDETARLADFFLTELDYQQGNITTIEYETLISQY